MNACIKLKFVKNPTVVSFIKFKIQILIHLIYRFYNRFIDWTFAEGSCPEPVSPIADCPAICPAIYSPVCAQDKDGHFEQFSNNCSLKSRQCGADSIKGIVHFYKLVY